MKPLTPEQQAFAEEHHGLLLDFMAKHSLGDDYYDLLANRYLKVVVRYLSEEALRKYSFSTLVWYHLRSELSNYARDQVGKPQEIPIEFYCEIPAPEIAPIDDGLWRVIEDRIVDRPPCSRCLHRNKMTVEEPCYSCIDLMDLSLHRPNVETEFASFTPATEVNHEE